MNDLGVCTWTYGPMGLGEIAARAKKTGFDGIEIFGDVEAYEPGQAKATFKEKDLKILSITPGDVDLAHPDPAVRKSAVDYMLKLLEFAAKLDNPLVGCHGLVGRIRPAGNQAAEEGYLKETVQLIARKAKPYGLRIVMEVLNRYESHLLNTAVSARKFVDDLGEDNVGILLDAYHMNIEESDLPEAIQAAGERLWLFHVADSNRAGVGYGHTDFAGIFKALREIRYAGSVILECSPPGPDPFAAIKDASSVEWLEKYYADSVAWINRHAA
jgi:D-psicose/D-tagatose/L-ribulose 3-epimerase